jgi:chromosome segregation ATPase
MSNASIESKVEIQGEQINHLKNTLERMEESVRANAESSKKLTEVVIDMAKTQEKLASQHDILTSLAVESKANSARLNIVESEMGLVKREVQDIPSMWGKISKIKEQQIKNSVITALVTTLFIGAAGTVISIMLKNTLGG